MIPMLTSRKTNNSPWRWFTILFFLFLVISFPVLLLFAILIWGLYAFFAGTDSKWDLRRILQRTEQALDPPILLLACLLVALSLFVTTEVGPVTHAGFPLHFVTIYNYPTTEAPVDFWARLAPNWNVDGRLFLNVATYYFFIAIVHQVLVRGMGQAD